MPATALIDDRTLRDNQSASVRDREISILRGMNAFFSADHFVQPAVPAAATQPAEVSTQAWASLRSDPRAVGFDYPSNGETRLIYPPGPRIREQLGKRGLVSLINSISCFFKLQNASLLAQAQRYRRYTQVKVGQS